MAPFFFFFSQVGAVPPGNHAGAAKHHASSRQVGQAKPVKPPGVAAPTSGSTGKFSTNKYRRSNAAGYK
jgi:hypothetical protein